MAKKEKLEAFQKVVTELPMDFNYELDLHIAELKRLGVKKTKSQLIAEFAQIGFLKEKCHE